MCVIDKDIFILQKITKEVIWKYPKEIGKYTEKKLTDGRKYIWKN